jgi:hypothetical protein
MSIAQLNNETLRNLVVTIPSDDITTGLIIAPISATQAKYLLVELFALRKVLRSRAQNDPTGLATVVHNILRDILDKLPVLVITDERQH